MHKMIRTCFGVTLLCSGLLAGSACDSGDDDGSGGSSQAGAFSGSGSSTGGAGGTSSGGTSSGGTSSGGTSSGGASSGGGGTTAGGGGGTGGAGGASGSAGSGGATGGSGSTGGSGGSSAAGLLTDAEILAVLDTLNLGEVTEAEAAQPRLMNDDVREYAEQMIEQHGAARAQVTATASTLMLAPANNPAQMQLKSQSDARVMAITNAEAAMVDTVYVSGQVMAHGAALTLLTELETAADAQPLKDLIDAQRSDVQQHLSEAMELP